MGGTASLAYTDKKKTKKNKDKKPTHLITTVNNFNNNGFFLDKNIEMTDLCFSSN